MNPYNSWVKKEDLYNRFARIRTINISPIFPAVRIRISMNGSDLFIDILPTTWEERFSKSEAA